VVLSPWNVLVMHSVKLSIPFFREEIRKFGEPWLVLPSCAWTEDFWNLFTSCWQLCVTGRITVWMLSGSKGNHLSPQIPGL